MPIPLQAMMLPPTSTASLVTAYANGRIYNCVGGAAILVPLADAAILEANGWKPSGDCAGQTSERPTSTADGRRVHRGFHFCDTTLGFIIVHMGNNVWRNPATGAVA